MLDQNIHPKWWQLNLIVPFTIILLIVDNRLTLPTIGHEIVEFVIIVFVYGLILLWLKSNSASLAGMDSRENNGKTKMIIYTQIELDETENEDPSMVEFFHSDMKGLLGYPSMIDCVEEFHSSDVDEQ